MKILKKLETVGEAISTTVQPITTSTSQTMETTMPPKSETLVGDTTVKNKDITEQPKVNVLEIDTSLEKEKEKVKPKENIEVDEDNKEQQEKETKETDKEKKPETKQVENMNGKLLSKKINGKNCKCKYLL